MKLPIELIEEILVYINLGKSIQISKSTFLRNAYVNNLINYDCSDYVVKYISLGMIIYLHKYYPDFCGVNTMNYVGFCGNIDVLKWLIKNCKTCYIAYPCAAQFACQEGNINMIKWLLDNYCHQGITLSSTAVGGQIELAKFLIKNRFKYDIPEIICNPELSLNSAICNGRIEYIKWHVNERERYIQKN